MSAPKFRPLRFGVTRVTLKDGVPGTHYLKADQDLQAFPDRLTDRLQHWAQIKPTQTLFARRVKLADGSLGDWRHVDASGLQARSEAPFLIFFAEHANA